MRQEDGVRHKLHRNRMDPADNRAVLKMKRTTWVVGIWSCICCVVHLSCIHDAVGNANIGSVRHAQSTDDAVLDLDVGTCRLDDQAWLGGPLWYGLLGKLN